MKPDEKHFQFVIPQEYDRELDDRLDGPRVVFVALLAAGLTVLIVLAFLWMMTVPIYAVP